MIVTNFLFFCWHEKKIDGGESDGGGVQVRKMVTRTTKVGVGHGVKAGTRGRGWPRSKGLGLEVERGAGGNEWQWSWKWRRS